MIFYFKVVYPDSSTSSYVKIENHDTELPVPVLQKRWKKAIEDNCGPDCVVTLISEEVYNKGQEEVNNDGR